MTSDQRAYVRRVRDGLARLELFSGCPPCPVCSGPVEGQALNPTKVYCSEGCRREVKYAARRVTA